MINVGIGRKKSYVHSAGLRHGFEHGRTQKGETEVLASQCVVKQSRRSSGDSVHGVQQWIFTTRFFSFLMVNTC